MRERRKLLHFTANQRGWRHPSVEVRESNIAPRGNAHYNRRRPDGPVCPDCGAPFEPICSTRTCRGSRIPRQIIRAEKRDFGTRRYDHFSPARALEAKEVGRRGTTHATGRGRPDERIAA